MKQSKTILFLFGLVGIGMLVGGIFFFISTKQFVRTALRTQGTVVDLILRKNEDGRYTYAPKVTFTANNGDQYTFVSGASANPPAFDRGEIIEVLYLAENPQGAKINTLSTLYSLPLIMGGMGLVFSLIGGIPGFLFLRRKKQIEYLSQYGMRISSKVTKIEYRKNYKINNKSPYRIWAEGTDPRNGAVTTFKSDNIWFNPKKFVQPGDIVEILIHPQKNNVYYMETPFLPGQGKTNNTQNNPLIS